MPAPTNYYVDPLSGNDTTGNGSLGNPWLTPAKAMAGPGAGGITRNATSGDQANVRDTAPVVLSASIPITAYGTPTLAAPLIWRGYSNTADDGGVGEISGGGAVSIFGNESLAPHMVFRDMHLHSTGAGQVVNIGTTSGSGLYFYNCRLGNSSGAAVQLRGQAHFWGCYIYSVGGVITGTASGPYTLYSCFLDVAGSVADSTHSPVSVTNCILYQSGLFVWGLNPTIRNNTFVGTGAAGQKGIDYRNSAHSGSQILNNIFVNYSGAGGAGIGFASGSTTEVLVYGGNKFYNCTNNTTGLVHYQQIVEADETLLANPLIDIAGDDFSITAELKAAGWPSSFLGSNTLQFLDPGAAQREEAGGGRRPRARIHGV